MRRLSVFLIIGFILINLFGCKEEAVTGEKTPPETPAMITDPAKPAQKKQIDTFEIEKNLSELTKNGSRKWGTEAELNAANYLKEQMKLYGYQTYIQEFPAYEFDISASVSGDYFELNPYNSEVIGTGHNIIADLTNQETDKTLVLAAHYDTISKELGIIDNTSGVVTLLETARLLM